VYNLYFGSATGDSNLKLSASNVAIGTTSTVTAVSSSTTTPPASLRNSLDGFDPSTVHPVFIVGEAALAWAGFYKSKILMSPTGATKDDPLAQRRTVGYKFFGKAVIKDQTRLLRLEVASAF
jgi:hypothetical protein